MNRFDLRTCVLLVSLMCFLTLVLPFCVPVAESKVTLPGGGTKTGLGGYEPPPPPADPDDFAVNTVGGTGQGLVGGLGFDGEARAVLDQWFANTGQRTPFTEAPAASLRLNSTRWSLLVWMLTMQLH